MHRMLLWTLLTVLVAGCVTADVKVNKDGSGTIALEYLMPTFSEQQTRKLLTAPGVTIKSLEIKAVEGSPAQSKKTVAQLEVSDLTKLAKIPLFRMFGAQVKIADEGGGRKRMQLLLRRARKATEPPQETVNTITVHFPGPVAESSAQITDSTVTWKFPNSDYFSKPEMKLTALYAVAPPGPAVAPPGPAEVKGGEKPANAEKQGATDQGAAGK
jgi:hypothetical protein